jgi:hypothetical protein
MTSSAAANQDQEDAEKALFIQHAIEHFLFRFIIIALQSSFL